VTSVNKPSILGLTTEQLVEAVKPELLRPYQARQIMAWVYRRGALGFGQMTDLAAPLRKRLSGRFIVAGLRTVSSLESSDGTRKLLLAAPDGQSFECVLIPGPRRMTACLSSQAGCRLGCAFCATGAMGLGRDLTPAEMAGQLLHLKKLAPDQVTNVVFMGMGEPFDNYENVLAAVRLINSPEAFGLGARHITVSTAGLVPGIDRLAREPEQFKLAVSLNAADDGTRDRLMPVNRRYPLPVLLKSVKDYVARTGKLVTFEYVLLSGINDRPEDARSLGRLLKSIPSKVNLIPYNGPPSGTFASPPPDVLRGFHRLLSTLHPKVTVRASKGADIAAACGMLKASCPAQPRLRSAVHGWTKAR
jgi:23S rRNA (adenine2503-C2)-methyltransferase